MLLQAFDERCLPWDGRVTEVGWAGWLALTADPDEAAVRLFERCYRFGRRDGLARVMRWRCEHGVSDEGTRALQRAMARVDGDNLARALPAGAGAAASSARL